MTDDKFKAELIRRLRERYRFTERDCTDSELIKFGKRQLSYPFIVAEIGSLKLFMPDNSYEREFLRYKQLNTTLLAEMACLRKRNAGLRGCLKEMRASRVAKDQKDASEG